MLSVASLQDGGYWFAVNAPADPADAQRGWVVRVRPLRPLTGFSDVPAVSRGLEPVPPGTPRRRLRQVGKTRPAPAEMEVRT
jgi:hypothetical protein